MAKKLTKEEAQMLQEAKDAKMAPKLESAFNAALTNTAPAPMPAASDRKAKGGVTRADGCAKRGKTKGTMVRMGG